MKGYTEIIEGMIDLLSTPEHWCKGILMSGDSYCLIGALNQVATGRWDWSCDSPRGLVKYFNKVACNRGFRDGWHVESNVIAFNNHPDTTHEDVILFLKEALYEVQNEERIKSEVGS